MLQVSSHLHTQQYSSQCDLGSLKTYIVSMDINCHACVRACLFYLQGCHGIRRCQIQVLGSVVVIAEHGQMSSQQILILYSLQTQSMNNLHISVCKRVQTSSLLRTHNVSVLKPSELPHCLLPKRGASFYGNILTEIEPYKRPDLECYNVSYKSAPCALDTQH